MAQFIIFIICYLVGIIVLGVDKVNDFVNPLYFLVSVCVVHMILARFTKRDPQLGQILVAKIRMLKNSIPRRLSA